MLTHKILLIVDAQNDFIDGALSNVEAQFAVPKICNLIKSDNWNLIVTTHDTHGEDYLDTKEGKALPVKHCIKGTNGWRLNNDIFELIYSKVYSKLYLSCEKVTFGDIFLASKIEDELEIEPYDKLEIHVAGFCTDICVISNVLMLKAEFPFNAEIYVHADCCAGVTPEKHNAALEIMKSCQINVI